MPVLRRARWLSAALIAPLLVSAALASSYVLMRCRLTGMVRLETCCPGAARTAPGDGARGPATVGEPGCCERVVVATGARRAPADLVEAAGQEAPVQVCWTLHDPDPPALLEDPSGRASLRRATARSRALAAPSFLLRHAFLI